MIPLRAIQSIQKATVSNPSTDVPGYYPPTFKIIHPEQELVSRFIIIYGEIVNIGKRIQPNLLHSMD